MKKCETVVAVGEQRVVPEHLVFFFVCVFLIFLCVVG